MYPPTKRPTGFSLIEERRVSTATTASLKERKAKRYVRLIPLDWIQTAAKLPGQALQVGVALWYMAGVTKKMAVSLSNARLKSFGVGRSSKRRALASLEAAGLVKVTQEAGCNPLVTIHTTPGTNRS